MMTLDNAKAVHDRASFFCGHKIANCQFGSVQCSLGQLNSAHFISIQFVSVQPCSIEFRSARFSSISFTFQVKYSLNVYSLIQSNRLNPTHFTSRKTTTMRACSKLGPSAKQESKASINFENVVVSAALSVSPVPALYVVYCISIYISIYLSVHLSLCSHCP